ncbi:Putative cytochrome c-type biogenesis protein, cycH [Oceanicola granulosus HTCC2516]|uniref:Putative cytochrome c-type biogenesis protein, cycH n=1 Tax=Oceanicola granulosus (strain ATCC BAA-861 / DSM 15982 / KCTC 12143 / HTCC2516) TaxID=314256 RepID=Q2CHJ9_OCEGH|nr:c-type cytochrome biogenesis protein CcmI [Oceanicola granulosus]EAR52295.1 Putative cytochrome c-type biogenesis protein, cycH [Oceanicola granulosus HTCC2516]
MLFYLICALLALAVTATLLAPLLRDGGDGGAEASDVDVYRGQLAEVDRDLARGTLAPEEAERTRTEIARRLLAADAEASAAAPAPRRATRVVAGLSALLVLGGGGAIYAALGAFGPDGPYRDLPRAERLAAGEALRQSRPSQAELQDAAPPVTEREAPEEYMAMVAELREIVPTRPDDVQGWALLARNEATLGNWPAALAAQQRLVALKGAETSLAERVQLLDLMVAATGGVVSPEAETLAETLLAADPASTPARYYLGLLYAQTDRPDIAVRLWRPAVENAAPDDLHASLAREQIIRAAELAGLDYTPPAAPAPRGPDAAAEAMDPEARAEMIRGMVAALSDRLATEGGPAEEWARLINAYAVLGEEERATAILAEARDVFAASARDLGIIDGAARRAGLP